MDNEKAHHHLEPREAEIAAAVKVGRHVTTLKTGIMTLAAAVGDWGLIPDEVDGLINTIRRRFTDLHLEGKLRPTDRTRTNKRGNPETVWVVGRDEEGIARAAKLKPQNMMRSRIAALEMTMAILFRRNGGPIDGFVQDGAFAQRVWTKDAYVMVRREDFDELQKLVPWKGS